MLKLCKKLKKLLQERFNPVREIEKNSAKASQPPARAIKSCDGKWLKSC
jgi:hypothetical protein